MHLIHDELRGEGLDLSPGLMGENVTTRGIDLLNLPAGTRLHLGETAVVEVTGLRTPCSQLNRLRAGLMAATRVEIGRPICFKAGVMSVVLVTGEVKPGDAIRAEVPPEPHRPLEPI